MAWSVLAGSTDGGGKRRLLTDWLCPLSLSLSLSPCLGSAQHSGSHGWTVLTDPLQTTLLATTLCPLGWGWGFTGTEETTGLWLFTMRQSTLLTTVPDQSFIFSAPLQSKASGLKTLFRTKLVSVGEIVGPSILQELFVLVHVVGLRSDNLSYCTITHISYLI